MFQRVRPLPPSERQQFLQIDTPSRLNGMIYFRSGACLSLLSSGGRYSAKLGRTCGSGLLLLGFHWLRWRIVEETQAGGSVSNARVVCFGLGDDVEQCFSTIENLAKQNVPFPTSNLLCAELLTRHDRSVFHAENLYSLIQFREVVQKAFSRNVPFFCGWTKSDVTASKMRNTS